MANEPAFFRLPAEIREKILRFALTPDEDDYWTVHYPESLFRTYEQPLPAVMRACKRMYTELSPFALTEIVIHESIKGSSTRTRIRCHGNLRFERLRHVSVVVAIENSDLISPSWSPFLLGLLKRAPNVDSLDIEFFKNEFQKEVEGELAAAEERRQNGQQGEIDAFVLKQYAQPEWLEEVALQPSLRKVSFQGNVSEIWLERLRRKSEGRIQVFSDGVRFREKQGDDERGIHTDDDYARYTQHKSFAETEDTPVFGYHEEYMQPSEIWDNRVAQVNTA